MPDKGSTKSLLEKFEAASLQRQIFIFFIGAIASSALLSSLALSWKSTHVAVERSVQQGISIANALARNSTLAILYGSEESAKEAIEATLSFPGIAQAAVWDKAEGKILYQYGQVKPWVETAFIAESESVGLEYEDRNYWQFGAIVAVTTGDPDALFDLNQPRTEVIGRIHLLISKSELAELKKSIVVGNFFTSLLLSLVLFFMLQRLIQRTAGPFSELIGFMRRIQGGDVGLRLEPKGAFELRYIAKTFNTMMDVLEQRDQELRTAMDAAMEASRLKSEFVANVSHEIRTPMNGILGMLNLLDESRFSDEERGYVRVAKESGHTLLYLINSILDFSKLSVERVKLEHLPLNLQHLLDNILALYSGGEKQHPVELTLMFDLKAPALLLGDTVRLHQLFSNIISNSIKFTEKGEVTVTVGLIVDYGDHCELEISIADTGIGIPSEYLERIFEAYSQQDGSINRRFGGTGLGLAISKRLVELMKGRITVESTVGQGTCFTLRLPFEKQKGLEPPVLDVSRLFDHFHLISPNDVRREGLINLARRFGLSYSWTDQPGDWQAHIPMEYLRETNQKRICVLINWPHGLGPFERDLEYLKNTANVFVIRYYHPAFETKEALSCIDLHLVKPVRQLQLEQELGHYFGQDLVDSERGKTVGKVDKRLGISVLVVEDNPVNQKVVKAHLFKLGFKADITGNGEEALEALKDSHYDLILMDCQMPILDGYGATQKIRSLAGRQASVPIIALSANISVEDQQKCKEAGMDGFIGKPFTREQLASELKKWLPGMDHG